MHLDLPPPPRPHTHTRPSSLAKRTPSGVAQYGLLKFPPLVVAASALLCAWSHLGNLAAIEHHMPQLCALCGVDQVSPPPSALLRPAAPQARTSSARVMARVPG